VRLRNPLSEDQSTMRTLLLGSLLDVARHNAARDVEDLRLFETGAVYVAGDDPLPGERRHVGVLLAGRVRPPSWRDASPPVADFFAARAALTTLLDGLRLEWAMEPASEPFLHPGRGAQVLCADEAIGWLGEVHPLVTRAWDLGAVAAFELDLDRLVELAAARVPRFAELPAFPAVRQDLAVVVGEDVPADSVVDVVRRAGAPLLESARVFDVYRGAPVGEGRVSLALALEFRAPDRTLTEEEVRQRRDAIAAALRAELGGELRA
jgi:phenylalanyl-tRNA synthetase beta chain